MGFVSWRTVQFMALIINIAMGYGRLPIYRWQTWWLMLIYDDFPWFSHGKGVIFQFSMLNNQRVTFAPWGFWGLTPVQQKELTEHQKGTLVATSDAPREKGSDLCSSNLFKCRLVWMTKRYFFCALPHSNFIISEDLMTKLGQTFRVTKTLLWRGLQVEAVATCALE